MSHLRPNQLHQPAASLVKLVGDFGAEEALVRLSFWGGRELRKNPEHPSLRKLMEFLSQLFVEFELEGVELTDEAVESIEDTLLSRRKELNQEVGLLDEKLLASLSCLSISNDLHPHVALCAAYSLLKQPGNRTPIPRGMKLISFAFFCGTIE